MDSQHNPMLNWPYFFQGKSIEELTQSLLVTTLELETTRIRAQEEIQMRDDQLTQLKHMLNQAITERDEAQENLQKLFLEKIMLQQQYLHQQPSGVSSIEDSPKIIALDSNTNFSSSDCEESIVSSPLIDPPLTKDQQLFLIPEKPLPENGKFLQAVMTAGPLLQTLLLAGPLPQWRHPPPPLDTHLIPPPPVTVPPPTPPPQLIHQECFLKVGAFSNINNNNCGRVTRKRGFCEGSDCSTDAKYQRIVPN